MKRVLLQPAYVLHRRAYRETSFLVEVFTPDHGRLTLLAKGVRKEKSALLGLLQPFTPLLISFSGKTELMALSYAEAHDGVKTLKGNCLFAGLYLNEILIGLLEKWDAHPRLYQVYEQTLAALQVEVLEQKILRSFERILLEELGYGLFPKTETELNIMFCMKDYYRFIPEQGFIRMEWMNEAEVGGNIFSGDHLIAIANEDWRDEEILRDAKRLLRLILTPLLGTRPIYSRQLFLQPEEKGK